MYSARAPLKPPLHNVHQFYCAVQVHINSFISRTRIATVKKRRPTKEVAFAACCCFAGGAVKFMLPTPK